MIRHYKGTLGFIFLFLGFINTVEAAATATADPDAAAGAPGRTVSAAGEGTTASSGPYQALMKAFMAQWVEKYKPADPEVSAGAAAAPLAAGVKTPTPAEAAAYAARTADVMAANPKASCEELSILLLPNPYRDLMYQWSNETVKVHTPEGPKEMRVPINLQASVANTIAALHGVICLASHNIRNLDEISPDDSTKSLPIVELRKVFKPGKPSTDITCEINLSIQSPSAMTGKLETKDRKIEVVDEEVLKGIIAGLAESLPVLNANASVLENMKALWATFKEMVAFYTETRLRLAPEFPVNAGGGAGASGGKVDAAKPAGGAGSMPVGPSAKKPAGGSGAAADEFMDVPLTEGSLVLTPDAATTEAQKDSKKFLVGRLIVFLNTDKRDGLPSLPGLENTWEEAKKVLLSSSENIAHNLALIGSHMLTVLDATAEVALRQKGSHDQALHPKIELPTLSLRGDMSGKTESEGKAKEKDEGPDLSWLSHFAVDIPIFDLKKGTDFNMEAAYWGLRFLIQQYEAKYEEYRKWLAASPEDSVWAF